MIHTSQLLVGLHIACTVKLIDGAGREVIDRGDWDFGKSPAWTAASLNKLAIAGWLDTDPKRLVYNDLHSLSWKPSDRKEGAGHYDKGNSPLSATYPDLLRDMLERSGNTAMFVLGRWNVPDINGWLKREGYTKTRLVPKGPGHFETGTTSPSEALRLLINLVGKNTQVLPTSALLGSPSYVWTPNQDFRMFTKQGQLDPDKTRPTYVRNEVGYIENVNSPFRVGYAIFTESAIRPLELISVLNISRIGAELFRTYGLEPLPVKEQVAALQKH